MEIISFDNARLVERAGIAVYNVFWQEHSVYIKDMLLFIEKRDTLTQMEKNEILNLSEVLVERLNNDPISEESLNSAITAFRNNIKQEKFHLTESNIDLLAEAVKTAFKDTTWGLSAASFWVGFIENSLKEYLFGNTVLEKNVIYKKGHAAGAKACKEWFELAHLFKFQEIIDDFDKIINYIPPRDYSDRGRFIDYVKSEKEDLPPPIRNGSKLKLVAGIIFIVFVLIIFISKKIFN